MPNRDCYETTIALADTTDNNALKPLSGIKVSVVSRGATDIPGSLVDIFPDDDGVTKGPDPKTGATGTNPFTTGASGAVRFWAEGPAKLDIVFEDIAEVPARIEDRTSWDVMPVSTTISAGPPPAQPQTAGSMHFRTDLQALYVSTGTAWMLVSASAPVGQIAAFGLASVVDPDGVTRWLICNGAACTAAYPVLRQALISAGSLFGTVGSDPALPDLRGRVPVGPDAGAARLGDLFGGNTLGASGGVSANQIDVGMLPQRAVVLNAEGYNVGWTKVTTPNGSTAVPYALGTDPERGFHGGGGGYIQNMQPYQIVNWFIKAKY